MMFKYILCLTALCFLTAKSENSSDVKASSTLEAAGTGSVKVEPTNISALYIGDLLRTKPQEVLEAAGSVHSPIISNQDFLSPGRIPSSPVTGRTFNYKAHGGHEYVETEYIHPSIESRSNSPGSGKRVGTSARVVPVNVLGHLLTVKPVRVVSRDTLPTGRNAGSYHKATQHPNDDCSKSGEHSYSSEEKPYIPEERTYRRAKQVAPDPQVEYRSPQNTYEDDRSTGYSSHSDPSTGSYNSRSYPTDTNTKSHSSGSYTKSKSTSTSRTVNSNRSTPKERVVPTTVSHAANYEKESGSAHGDKDIIIYKVREPPSQAPNSYSDNSGREYPPSSYESEHKSGPSNSPYSQYPSEVRKTRKHPHGGRSFSNSEQPLKDSPQQYGPGPGPSPAPYEQEQDSYDKSSYSAEQRYRDQNNPSSGYHNQEQEYTPRPDTRGIDPHKSHYQSYQSPESGHQYDTEKPNKHPSRKRQRHPLYERPSNDGTEDTRYRAREPATREYSYPNEHLQSSRSRKERPQGSYETYEPQEPHTESVPPSQTYERNHHSLRPSEEKQMSPYVYEATPHQLNTKLNQDRVSQKRQYRESPRSARSPVRYLKSAIVEERGHLPASENKPLILVSRESKPYVSHSESYSRSGFGVDDSVSPEQKFNNREHVAGTFEQPKLAPEGRQNGENFGADYPIAYKPYNSEYPASYANDQHHNSHKQHQTRTYVQPQPYDQSHSYGESPPQYQPQPYEQPHSYEEGSPQYQPHGEHQPYEHGGPHDDSSEQEGTPVKKSKNHHYISKIEGYKEDYGSSEPLNIDDAFFEKYGISKTAKVIVAHAMKPNLFVADGSKVPEGGHSESSGPVEEERFEPNFKENFREDFKEDSYNDSPEEMGAPKHIPGSFDDLVNTNPRFLRKLPHIMSPSDGFFKVDSSDASFDDAEFRNVEQKGFVVSQGPREIVQQHGDGVSRIIFNLPKDESKDATSNVQDYKDENRRKDDQKLLASGSTVMENTIKSD